MSVKSPIYRNFVFLISLVFVFLLVVPVAADYSYHTVQFGSIAGNQGLNFYTFAIQSLTGVDYLKMNHIYMVYADQGAGNTSFSGTFTMNASVYQVASGRYEVNDLGWFGNGNIVDMILWFDSFDNHGLSGVSPVTLYLDNADAYGNPAFGANSNNRVNASANWGDYNLYPVVSGSSLNWMTGYGGSNSSYQELKYTPNSTVPPTANFTAFPRSGEVPLVVNFTDTSQGSPTSYLWDFGDGQTSTEANPQHSYMNIGYYTVNLTASNFKGNSKKTEWDYITVFPVGNVTPPGGEYHIDVDVKDTYGGYVENSNVGIWDGSAWFNATCPSGACGFIHHGLGGMLPVELKDVYTVKAWKNDYSSAAQTFTMDYDHYPVSLTLTPDYSNETLVSRINVDVKDKAQNRYIENAQVSLYRYSNATWDNYTCPTGSCGFKDEAFGATYDIWATREGYISNFTKIIHNNNWEIYDLYLDPINPFDKNITLHMDIDVRNYTDNYPIEYSDLGLYDIIHDEWRNTTCVSGACGFTSSGSQGQYPLKLYTAYGISAKKTGYVSQYKQVYLSYDHQLFTVKMVDARSLSPYELNVSALPSYSIPVFPTVTGTIALNQTVNISSEVQFLNITIPSSLPPLPSYMNQSMMREDLLSKVPQLAFIIQIADGIIGSVFYMQSFFSLLILGPFLYIFGANTSVMSILTMYLSSWSVMAAPIVWVIGLTGEVLGPKIQAYIIIVMAFDIVLQIRDTVARN